MFTTDQLEHIVTVLNRALDTDPQAINNLFSRRENCNEALSSDPTIQAREYPDGHFDTSVLSLLNGFWFDEFRIWMELNDDGTIGLFGLCKSNEWDRNTLRHLSADE